MLICSKYSHAPLPWFQHCYVAIIPEHVLVLINSHFPPLFSAVKFMVFHLIGIEIVEIADGGGTLASARAFIVIRPMAAEIFQSGTKWRTDGQTNAIIYKTSRWFEASKQAEKRLSPPPSPPNDNGGVISVFRAKLESRAFRSDFVFCTKGHSDKWLNTHTCTRMHLHTHHYNDSFFFKTQNLDSTSSTLVIPASRIFVHWTSGLTGNQILEKFTQ